ncbi:hypothetical protein [Ensifer sp. SL37]|uniref:hypothetical protein n=1 Tax=Ensifer sp. SL37 TaxID=2995137 RepID=UPI002275DB00|nr:hypothetical protein [Ensifer sp. SL37]MCY1741151.1 hypothetical protein [Ensifer sp. SL37]
MADIRINQLPAEASPVATDVVPIDGATTRKTTIQDLVLIGRPTASQVEAEAGTNPTKVMTPLTTKQSIASEVGVSLATAAQGILADSSLQPSDIGATAGTVAAGDDARITGAAQKAQNLNDLADKASSRLNVKVPTYAATRTALKALDTTKDVSAILQESGREGVFTWTAGDFSALVAADTQSAVYVKADAIAATAGAWVRQVPDLQFNVSWFGAVGDAGVSGSGATNDTNAFQLANNLLALLGGGTIVYNKRHYLSTSLNLSRGVSLRGPSENADPGNSFSTVTAFYAFMRAVPALILTSAVEIRLSSACSLVSNYIFRSGLALNGTDLATNYAGTPINIVTTSLTTDGVLVERNTIAGFSQAIRAQDAGRLRIENNFIDANNGIWLTNSGDFPRYEGNHLYNILQANATGHDTTSLRSGTAFKFDGSPLGGAYLGGNFDYGYNISIDIATPGQVAIVDHWFDGPTVLSTGRPLDPNSIGIRTAAVDYLETMILGIRGSCKGNAFDLGASSKGMGTISNIILYHNNVCFRVDGQNLSISNFTARAYDAFANFNNKAAANTALLTNGVLYDRNAPGNPAATPPTGIADPIDINGGTGIPKLVNVTRVDGSFDLRNELRPDVTASAGVITIPGAHEYVRVTGTPTVTNILPPYDGRKVTCEATGAGLVFSGSNFLFATGSSWTSTQAGASITFAYSRFLNKWAEVSRGAL